VTGQDAVSVQLAAPRREAQALSLAGDMATGTPAHYADMRISVPACMQSVEFWEGITVRAITRAGEFKYSNVYCRRSVDHPARVRQPRVEDLEFKGKLERRLNDEKLHVMITNVQYYAVELAELHTLFIATVSRLLDVRPIELIRPSLVLFLSGAKTIARLHNDPEHNLLFHLHGEKRVHVYRFVEQEVCPADRPPDRWTLQIEDSAREFISRHADDHAEYHVTPGSAVYLPRLAPHWVRALEAFNVSLTFSFYDGEAVTRQKITRFNEWLRRRGLKPRAFAQEPRRLQLKCLGFDVLERFNRISLS